MLWALMLVMPFPYIANEAGWMVDRSRAAAVDRLRTDAHRGGRSPNVDGGRNALHADRLCGMYFLLGVLFLMLVLREIADRATAARRDAGARCCERCGFGVMAFMLTAYVLLDGYDFGVARISPLVARTRPRAGGGDAQHRAVLERQRSLARSLAAARSSRSFRRLRARVFRLLSALHGRAVAADVSRHRDRAAQAFPTDLWHHFLGCGIFPLERAADPALRRGARESGARRTARCCWIFSRHVRVSAQSVRVAGRARSRVAALGQHGAAFMAMRVDGDQDGEPPGCRARSWWVVLALFLHFRRGDGRGSRTSPGAPGLTIPLVALGALIWLRVSGLRGRATSGFAASSAFLAALLAEAARTLYPYLISAYPADRGRAVDLPSRAFADCDRRRLDRRTIAGSVAALAYGSAVWRRMGAKVRVE